MAKAVVTFQSDDKDVLASIEKMNAKLTEMQAKQQQGNAAAKSGFETSIASLASMVSAYLSVSTAIATINAGLQTKIRLEKESLTLQTSAAPSQRDLLANMGFASPQEQQKVLDRIREISIKHGIPESQLHRPGGMALSGSGGNFDNAMNALDYAAGVGRGDEATTGALAMAYQTIARASDSGDVNKAPGIAAAMGNVSNVASTYNIATSLAPAFVGVSGFGGTDAEAGALIAAYTTATGDVTGKQSSTASISSARQLEEFLPKDATYTYENGRKKLKRKGTGLTTTDQRIAYMQGHPELLPQFMSTGHFEQEAFIPTQDLLTAGSGMAQQYEGNKEAFRREQERADKENLADVLNRPELQQLANKNEGRVANNERFTLRQREQAEEASARDAYVKMLEAKSPGILGYMINTPDILANDWFGTENQYTTLTPLHARRSAAMLREKPADRRTKRENDLLQMYDDEVRISSSIDPVMERQNKLLEEQNRKLGGIQQNQRAGNARTHNEGR